MAFKESQTEFQLIDMNLIEPDPAHARKQFDGAGLKALANSIRNKGLIHPVVVQPANAAGRHTLIVGERRWRAAQIAGETTLPALVRACTAAEALEIQVFENIGLGVRTPLEPREMANAIQTIADNFATKEAAAEHFGRSANWLNQATAAANLSPKVTALLDSGKISSTTTAIQLEKLAQKNEARADTLMTQIEQLPEGEKLPKQVMETVLSEEGVRRSKKKEEAAPAPVPTPAQQASANPDLPPWESAPEEIAPPAVVRRRVNPSKVKMVADILGLSDGDEDEVLARLIDEFLALKAEGQAPV